MNAVERVKQVLTRHGCRSEVVFLQQSAHTAQQAAAALECDIAQIVKSLIFKTKVTQQPVLALVSGDKRLDGEKLAGLVGQQLGKADADFVKQKTGFSIGGVAPVGSLSPLPVYMDETLLRYKTVYAAAGHPKSIFEIEPHSLADVAEAIIADLVDVA